MRLSDITGRGEAPLPAEVEAELEALDAALRGEELPQETEGLNALVSDVRSQRPEPGPEFGAALDAWAAAGFPRGRRPGLREEATSSDPGGRFRAFLASLTPRRLTYAGGAAAALVVLVVAVSQVDVESGDQRGDSGGAVATTEEASGDGDDSGGVAPLGGGEPTQQEDQNAAAESGALPNQTLDRDGRALKEVEGGSSAVDPAGGRDVRRVQRDAQLTLAAPVDEVQDVTNEAIGVVESNRGIVLNSQTTGTDESARATLRLVIPTRRLDTTLDQLSDLADVTSLSEGSVDITRPFVDARDKLQGLYAERRSLLAQIEAAETEEELDQLKDRLESLQQEVARAKADFENIERRARQSNVTLEVTSDGADEGDWSLEDALDDAGRVLTVGAGIALISGAVLLPLALIAALAYFVLSASRRRARERTLDE